MRKLKLQMQLTVNGFVAGANGELDWMVWDWDDKLKNYVGELTDSMDTILMGRKMTDGFISHWSNVLKDKNNPEYATAKKFIDTPKVVFTKTLESCDWINTTLATGDIVEEINSLKRKPGKDIIVYGGASFVSSLVQNNLIDEYHLFINPAVISQGMTIFGNINTNMKLKLENNIRFECGIVLNHYTEF